MYTHNIEFLSALHAHQEKSGITKKSLADKLGYDASHITRIFQGERKASPKFIQDFCEILDLTIEEKVALFKLAGLAALVINETSTFFDKNKPIYQNKSLAQIAQTLNEWKQIHTTAQALFLSTETYMKVLYRLSREPVEQAVFEIEEIWFTSCEPKAKKVREVLKNITSIKHPSLDNFSDLLAGENSIAELIHKVSIHRSISLQQLKGRTFELKESLVEVLDLADLHIIKIADGLSEMV